MPLPCIKLVNICQTLASNLPILVEVLSGSTVFEKKLLVCPLFRAQTEERMLGIQVPEERSAGLRKNARALSDRENRSGGRSRRPFPRPGRTRFVSRRGHELGLGSIHSDNQSHSREISSILRPADQAKVSTPLLRLPLKVNELPKLATCERAQTSRRIPERNFEIHQNSTGAEVCKSRKV